MASSILGTHKSFREKVLAYEAKLISEALRDAKGNLRLASELLGFDRYQRLQSILNTRHKGLRVPRNRARKRK